LNHLDDYLKRSGDKELPSGNIEENENGFCVWREYENNLVLVAVYGNGEYWNQWADLKAEELKKENIFFATKRNPKGFVRKYGYQITGYILERSAQWAA
jgi:hypothetical protein